MAFKSEKTGHYLPFASVTFNVFVVLTALMCETCITCIRAESSQSSLVTTTGEVSEEIGNQLDETGTVVPPQLTFLENQDGDDDDSLIMYKRHLASIAALSGSKPHSGSRTIISPSKKHLGSIAAAQSSGRGTGRNLDMYKRHLGAIMALSGQKQKPLTRSLKDPIDYVMDASSDKYGGESSTPIRYAVGLGEGEMTPPYLMMYAGFPNGFHDDTHQMKTQASYAKNFGDEDSNEDEISYKSKRFLGSLARGNWFPRNFRGVSENSFGKRHIGSVARLGWIPHAKGNSRLNLLLEDQRGEFGLKRNDMIMTPRSHRMLYHFSAPSLWTSPRGKK